MSRVVLARLGALLAALALIATVLAVSSPPAAALSSTVVISQVYGGGGNSGAPYRNDFVELFNLGPTTVSLAGWSVQYAATTGSTWSRTNLSGTIAPGRYYLVQMAGGSIGALLPTPDVTGSLSMSATAGKVVLVNDQTTIATGTVCPTGSSIVDKVGYGTGTNCYEGSGPAPAPSSTTADLRNNAGYAETDNNVADFSVGAPNPRNTSSPLNVPPAVTTQPADQTVSSGSTATFTAAASGSPAPTVKWQVSSDGSTWADIPGATSTTLTFTASISQSGYRYRAIFANVGGTAITNAASLTVHAPPTITVQPVDQTVCSGSLATFTATASGSPAPTVQWQVSSDGSTWADIPGATSATLSFAVTASQTGHRYRAVFTNSLGTATSDAATLTVNTPPVVTTQPVDQTVDDGQSVTFTAGASGSPTPTVKWQVSGDGGGTWNDVAGATSATLAFTAAATQTGYRYRAVFTNTCTAVTTNAATLTVTPPLVVISQIYGGGGNSGATLKSDFIELFNRGTTTVSLDGWSVHYASTTGSTWFRTNLSGTIAPNHYYLIKEYTGPGGTVDLPTPDASGVITIDQARGKVVLVTNQTTILTGTVCPTGSAIVDKVGYGSGTNCFEGLGPAPTLSNTTAAVRLGEGWIDTNDNAHDFRAAAPNPRNTASPPNSSTAPTLAAEPSDQTVCAGSTATFLAAASGSPAPSVQWQESSDGSIWADIPGATSATLSFTATTSQNGFRYRAVFANDLGSVTTAAAVLTVNTPPTITTQPVDTTVDDGHTATFTAAASGSPMPTVQWQESSDGSTWNDIPGATSTALSFTTSASQNGYRYRAVFTNGCGTATTNAASLTVNTAPSITTQPLDRTVCAGSAVTFIAAASGTPVPTVQWQESSDGSTWADIPGATSTTLRFTAAASQTGNRYRAVFTNTVGTATTSPASLTVNMLPAVTTQPVDQTVSAGFTATFTAAASGSPAPTMKWQESRDGSTWNDIPGATSTRLSFTTIASQNGYRYRAVFTNGCGTATTNAASLTVVLITVLPATLPDAAKGVAYGQALRATGGSGPYTFAVTAGSLPPGLRLSRDGLLSGTPTEVGTSGFTITATDVDGRFGSRSYSLSVRYGFLGLGSQQWDSTKVNVALAGATLQVLFSLGGNEGKDVFAGGMPASQPVSCATLAPLGPLSPTRPQGATGLFYQPIAKTYMYLWTTNLSWAGTCRRFVMTLNDGSTHTMYVRFVSHVGPWT